MRAITTKMNAINSIVVKILGENRSGGERKTVPGERIRREHPKENDSAGK